MYLKFFKKLFYFHALVAVVAVVIDFLNVSASSRIFFFLFYFGSQCAGKFNISFPINWLITVNYINNYIEIRNLKLEATTQNKKS